MKARTFDTDAEWLEARREGFGIGASTVGALLGLSSFRTPWDVWAAHHAPDALPQDSTAAQRRGHALEHHVGRVYAAARGFDLTTHDRTIWTHEDHTWARCSPDASVVDAGVVGLAEIKTARNGWDWTDAPQEITDPREIEYLPHPAYGAQCYWQLLVSGRPWCDLVVFPLGHDVAAVAEVLADSSHAAALGPLVDALASRLVVCRVHASEPFQRQLGGWVEDWRTRHLVNAEEPAATGSKYAGPHHGRQEKSGALEVELDHPLTVAADTLYHARRKKKDATAAEKEATAQLKQAAQGVQEVRTPRGIVRWKKHGKGQRLVLLDWVASTDED